MLFWLVTWSVILLAVPRDWSCTMAILITLSYFCFLLFCLYPFAWYNVQYMRDIDCSVWIFGSSICLFWHNSTYVAKCFRRTSCFLLGVMLSLHSKYYFLLRYWRMVCIQNPNSVVQPFSLSISFIQFLFQCMSLSVKERTFQGRR